MDHLDSLLAALDESTITKRIRNPHDDARNSFHLESNKVRDFDEFTRIIADYYYNHHFGACVSPGSGLTLAEAAGRAKEILERDYHRRNGDIVTAYIDAHKGDDGGLRAILDKITEALKTEAIERYTRDMFDRHVAPSEWNQKVRIIRQFLARFSYIFGDRIRPDQAEEYAHNYELLIRAFVAHNAQTAAIMRRK